MSRTYDPKEIAAWKAQIYGNNGTDGRVDDWASTDQSVGTTSPRKSVGQKKWGSTSPTKSSGTANNESYSSSSGDWLSPSGAVKKSYKVKGAVAVKQPDL
jgi:hypothetical protein